MPQWPSFRRDRGRMARLQGVRMVRMVFGDLSGSRDGWKRCAAPHALHGTIWTVEGGDRLRVDFPGVRCTAQLTRATMTKLNRYTYSR